DIVKNPPLDSVVIDRKKNRAFSVVEITRPDGRRSRGVGYTMFGKEGFVSLLCCSYDEEFDANLLTFQSMGDSFCFDPDFELIARRQQPLWPVVVVVAAGSIVVIAIFLKILWKPRPKTD